VPEQTLPSPATALVKDDLRPDETWYQCFSRMWSAFTALNTTVGGKAAQTQTVCASFAFKFPADGGERVIINNPFAWSITAVTTRTLAGTSTVTTSINGTPLGGLSNDAATDEQVRTHSTANAVAIGDDIEVEFASTSADCENLCLTIAGTRTLS
jgi:hypothetical protein